MIKVTFCFFSILSNIAEIFGKAPDEVTIPHLLQLDQYQEKAVKEALVKPFTMIQGPPGKIFIFVESKGMY